MGGWGSGRQNGRPVADEALFVDIAYMVRTDRAIPGSLTSGTLSWNRNGEPAGSISYKCDMREIEQSSLELIFSVSDPWSGEKQSIEQRIVLTHTVPNYGGRRWWMLCPVNGRRVRKIYCPAGGGRFASRTAWKLGYRSQRESERDRPFSRLNKLQRQLGCYEGYEMPIRRPKGMWYRTYQRHLRRYEEIEHDCDIQMCMMAAKLTGLGDRFLC